MKDKNTIINEMCDNTAYILEMRMESNAIIAERFEAKDYAISVERASRLREQNNRIKAAVELLRENAGCWA